MESMECDEFGFWPNLIRRRETRMELNITAEDRNEDESYLIA